MQSLISWQRHVRYIQIILGLYLCFHFAHLIPWSYEMFGAGQVFQSPKLNGTYFLFPNILFFCGGSKYFILLFLVALGLASLTLVSGRYITAACLFIWYGWCCLFNANNLILNPGLSYIGWLLLALALIGAKPKRIHKELYWGAWLLLGIGYSISGYAKANSPSWQDGSALLKVINNPLARDYFLRDWAAAIPMTVLRALTWLTFLFELLYLPLIFFAFTRKWAWFLMVGLHISIMFLISFADLTIGMIVFHLFVFNQDWIKGKNDHIKK